MAASVIIGEILLMAVYFLFIDRKQKPTPKEDTPETITTKS